MSKSTSTVRKLKSALVGKFRQLRDELNAEVLEAEERIDGALTALVAGEHVAMIGPPGTAKTFLVDRLIMRITDVRYFSELMRKTMSPESVYGQVSILGMQNDEWRFVTKGMLPEADAALLDEFPRTSDAILNGLLSILNERRFRNNGETSAVPLSTAFLCANSLPVGEDEHDLEAFWDRVVMRFFVELPKDRATWRAIARMRHDPNPTPILSWDEVLQAKAEARALPIPDETFDAIDEIREAVVALGIEMSPRRVRQMQFVAASAAWLDGADEVRPEHCDVLRHMLWDEPEQRHEIDKVVSTIVSPGQKQAIELADAVDTLVAETDDAFAEPADKRIGRANELFTKSAACREELDEFLATANGRALRTVEAASRTLDVNHLRLLEEAYGMNTERLAAARLPS